MEIIFDNVNYNDANISFNINGSGIYSFIGTSNSIKSLIIDFISGKVLPSNGEIKIKKNIKIGVCRSNPYIRSSKSIREQLKNILMINNYKEKEINQRIKQSLMLVNLNEEYLDKKTSELEYVEAKKVSLIYSLVHNPQIIVIEDYTDGIINNDKKDFARLIRILVKKYNKIVILLTKDTSFCYEVSDTVFLLNDKKIVKVSNKSIIENTVLLTKLGLEVPPIVRFINECKKNNHDIDYYNNILDLIKSIYREVM